MSDTSTPATESAIDADDFSLADFADIDVSGIAEIRFETLPMGVYEFEVTGADLSQVQNKDDEKRFVAQFEFKILSVKSILEANVDKDALVGKTHTEKQFVNPGAEKEDIEKAIGRIRAYVTDMGCNSAGKLGDIVRNTKGNVFTAKIIKQKDKNDKSIEYARLKFDPPKKA